MIIEKEYYRVGDFVVCLGEGDTLFTIAQIGTNDMYLLISAEKPQPNIHGWEMERKLYRINKSQTEKVTVRRIKSGLWNGIVYEWNSRQL